MNFVRFRLYPEACRTCSAVFPVAFLLFKERGKERIREKKKKENWLSREWASSCLSIAPWIKGQLYAIKS
jgi:hypothetical protein